MAKILVICYSRTGNTTKLAEAVVEGATSEGAEADLRTPDKVEPADLLQYDGIVVGSPVYYGLPAAEIKAMFDESVSMHGRLAGRVGGAFATSANVGGGNESTCLAILQMMLVHGMVVVGSAEGDHYGPVAVGSPDRRALDQSKILGKRVARLAAAVKDVNLKA